MTVEIARAPVSQLPPIVAALTADVERQFGRLSATQLNWSPAPGEWGVGQCLDHLMIVNRSYTPQFDQILAGTYRPSVWTRIPGLPSWVGRWLIDGLLPEAKTRMAAPPGWRPTTQAVPADIVARFVAQQAWLTDMITRRATHDPERTILSSPAAFFLTYSLADALRLLVVHEQHHVAQATRVLAAPGFPAA